MAEGAVRAMYQGDEDEHSREKKIRCDTAAVIITVIISLTSSNKQSEIEKLTHCPDGRGLDGTRKGRGGG